MDLGPLLHQDLLDRRNSPAVPSFPESLSAHQVRLEPLDVARHLEPLYAAANGSGPNGEPNHYDADALIWRYMFGGPYPTLAHFADYLNDLAPMDKGLALVVRDLKADRIAGLATYCSNVPDALRIELGGIWYAPYYQRSHVNSQTIYLMLQHAFETLGYRRVEWKCDAHNQRSRKAALRLGFQFEGIFKQHMIIKNRNRDTAWFAMMDHEWPAAKIALEARF